MSPPDDAVAAGRLRRHAHQLVSARDRPAHRLEFGHDDTAMGIDCILQSRRRQPGPHRPRAGVQERPRHDDGSARSVADLIARLPGELAHCLHAHLPLAATDIDFLKDRIPVAQEQGLSMRLADEDRTPRRSERGSDQIGRNVYAAGQEGAGNTAGTNDFRGHTATLTP
jgi:hypothetical protein